MLSSTNIREKAVSGMLWKMLQSIGTQLISFVVSIVLARILAPSDYGVVAMVTVFTNIALVFINTGFSTAIIQNNKLNDEDISTLFFAGILLSFVLYGVLYVSSPVIASYYGEPSLVQLLRIGGLILPICSFSSVQQSLLIKSMQFKKLFVASFFGACAQGLIGISMAIKGHGSWSLMVSSLSNYLVITVVLWVIVSWKPMFVIKISSLRKTFSFSVKVLLSELFNSIFNNIRAIIIGKQYSATDLAYYNKGYQLPTLIMNAVDGSMNSVLFSALSKYQDNWEEEGLGALRKMMKASLYVCAPLMIGLVVVSKPLIILLLTEKWSSSIVFVRLVAIICLFWPLSAQRNALNARGLASVSLKLNIFSKVVTVLLLLLTYRISVELMVFSTIVSSVLNTVVEAFVYQKYLSYRIAKQCMDIFPSVFLAIIMGVIIWPIQYLAVSNFLIVFLQVIIGALVYLLLSIITKNSSFLYLFEILKGYIKKNKRITQ